MRKESSRSPSESRAHWEDLEEWVRGQIQGLIQELLEEEITELLGRAKSARGSTLDGAPESATSRSGSRGVCCRCSPARARRLPI